MRSVPRTRPPWHFGVRTRLTLAFLAVTFLSWALGLLSFRYFMQQDIRRFNQEMAARSGGHFRLVGPMGRLDFGPRPGVPPPGEAPRPGDGAKGSVSPQPGSPDARADNKGRPPGGPPPGGRGRMPRPVTLSMWAQGIAAVVLAMLAGWWMSRRFTKPLAALAEGATAFHEQNFGHRIPVCGSDEIAEVAATMNEMAAKVGAQIAALEEDAHRRRQVLADVAHELRSPVTTLGAMAAAMRDGLADEPGRRREALAFMIDAAGRMRRLVDDLLEVARLDLREVPLAPLPVDLRSLADDAVHVHEPGAEEAGIRLLPVADGPPVVVEVDPARISQVLDNLLDNAIAYAGRGAEVGVTVTASPPGFIVRDTGAGIAAQHLPFLFDPFYRADAARTPGSNHSGLGLRIARGLIEAHGGTLTLESVEGQGTTVTVTLPAAEG